MQSGKEFSMKLSDVRGTIKSLQNLKTSTGETFSVESGASALIKLSYLKAEIEAAEKAIKERLPEGFVFEDDLGKIAEVKTAQYEQNIPVIIDQMTARGVDWKPLVKFAKTGLDKTLKAIVEANETKTGESSTFKVTKKVKETATFDFDLE